MILSPLVSRFALVACLALAAPLAGCASAELVEPPANTESSPIDRQASDMGVEYCIVNDSSMRLNVQWRGFPEPIDIPRGATQCNSGQNPSLSGPDNSDMRGTLGYEPPAYPGTFLHLTLVGTHKVSLPPVAGAYYTSQGREYGICQGFTYAGQTEKFNIDWIHAELTQLPSTDKNDEFVLRITDSTKPYFADETKCSKDR